jgi:hypothetical protein
MIFDLYKGKISLPRTFWIFGVSIWLFLSFGLSRFIKFLLSIDSIEPSVAVIGVVSFYLIYTCSIPFAIWKSANQFNGKKIWSVLAKIYAVLMYGVFLWPAVSHMIPLSVNPNTALVISKLHPTQQKPFIGFWKGNSYEQFGVAITDAGNGLYSISFCGPGGCFEPGEWTPNTTIINDPHYRIINDDTIEFVGENGSTIYKRFTKGMSNTPQEPIR